MKKAVLLLSIVLIATSAWAGGSIFGGHKHKMVNINGVNAINVRICDELECPPVRIIDGECDGDHMSLHWGVCLCDEGYTAKEGICIEDIEQTIDGWTGDENKNCDINKKGICSVCLSIENTVGADGKDEFWADSNALCGKNEVCSKGVCQPVSGYGCVKNSDCIDKMTPDGDECGKSGCYCSYNNSYKNLGYPTMAGTCTLNNDYIEFFYGADNERRIAVRTEYDMWSSKNFCESLNMRLMGWNELNSVIVEGKVVLDTSEGTHLKKAMSTIYPTGVTGFYYVQGFNSDYALIKMVQTFADLYSPGNMFFFCR